MTEDKDGRPRLLPTGKCWCGCGNQTSARSYFCQGHDKLAEAALMRVEYHGEVAQLLHAHGFNPGRSVLDAAVRTGSWRWCRYCKQGYAGAPLSLRKHLQQKHPVSGLSPTDVLAELAEFDLMPGRTQTLREGELRARNLS